METYDRNIGHTLRLLRTERGWSQEYVGNVLDISPSAYSKYESGKTEIRRKQLQTLADLYSVKVDDLINGLDTMSAVMESQQNVYKKSSKVTMMIELDGNESTINNYITLLRDLNKTIQRHN